jgi:hypothetical protein
MTDPNVPERLQFDHAATPEPSEPAGDAPGDAPAKPTIPCSRCSKQLSTYYYSIDGETVCAHCKQEAARSGAAQRGGGAFMRACIFGLGAAILGAIIYYGVIAITGFEIGIVAILTGFLVGVGVRFGARGGGGRRYQIVAAALTYLSVGMAYAPLTFKAFAEGKSDSSVEMSEGDDAEDADSLAEDNEELAAERAEEDSAEAALAAAEDSTTLAISEASVGPTGLAIALALGATFLFIFVLPVMVIVGSLPSGLISALIIGIGIRQAWQMTGGHMVTITGPYKVGDAPPAAEPLPST